MRQVQQGTEEDLPPQHTQEGGHYTGSFCVLPSLRQTPTVYEYSVFEDMMSFKMFSTNVTN